MALTLRSVKGEPLTWNEVDGNWLFLEEAITDLATATNNALGTKISLDDLSVVIAAPSGSGNLSYNDETGVFTFTPPVIPTGGGGNGGGISFEDLSVTVTGPVAGENGMLEYNSSNGTFSYRVPSAVPELTKINKLLVETEGFPQPNPLFELVSNQKYFLHNDDMLSNSSQATLEFPTSPEIGDQIELWVNGLKTSDFMNNSTNISFVSNSNCPFFVQQKYVQEGTIRLKFDSYEVNVNIDFGAFEEIQNQGANFAFVFDIDEMEIQEFEIDASETNFGQNSSQYRIKNATPDPLKEFGAESLFYVLFPGSQTGFTVDNTYIGPGWKIELNQAHNLLLGAATIVNGENGSLPVSNNLALLFVVSSEPDMLQIPFKISLIIDGFTLLVEPVIGGDIENLPPGVDIEPFVGVLGETQNALLRFDNVSNGANNDTFLFTFSNFVYILQAPGENAANWDEIDIDTYIADCKMVGYHEFSDDNLNPQMITASNFPNPVNNSTFPGPFFNAAIQPDSVPNNWASVNLFGDNVFAIAPFQDEVGFEIQQASFGNTFENFSITQPVNNAYQKITFTCVEPQPDVFGSQSLAWQIHID